MTEQEKEALLNRARNDYVVGVKYRSLWGAYDTIVESTKIVMEDETIYARTEYPSNSNRRIYQSGEWAAIISSPKPANLIENFILF